MKVQKRMIYIVQHPQTKWNARSIVQGHLDSPLTAQGRKDAVKYGKKLIKKDIQKIVASDLGRCVETAGIISHFIQSGSIFFTPLLREQNFGVLNGKSDKEVSQKMNLNDPYAKPYGGESFVEMSKRIITYLKKLQKKEKGNFLIITHNGPLRAVIHSELKNSITLIH